MERKEKNENKKKATKIVPGAGVEPGSPAWQHVTLRTEPRRHLQPACCIPHLFIYVSQRTTISMHAGIFISRENK